MLNELLEVGVVAGLTGPDRSAWTVLKIRPLLVIDLDTSALLLETFDVALVRAH